MINTLLLDLDGVLQFGIDNMQAHMTSVGWRGDFSSFLSDLFDDAEYRETLTGKADIESVLQRKLCEFDQKISTETFLKQWSGANLVRNHELLEVLEHLRDTSIHLASNQDPVRGASMRHYYRRYTAISQMFFSYEIGYMKPDARYFVYVLERLGVDPSTIVFVDDSPQNVEKATDIGMKGIRYQEVGSLMSMLEDMGICR